MQDIYDIKPLINEGKISNIIFLLIILLILFTIYFYIHKKIKQKKDNKATQQQLTQSADIPETFNLDPNMDNKSYYSALYNILTDLLSLNIYNNNIKNLSIEEIKINKIKGLLKLDNETIKLLEEIYFKIYQPKQDSLEEKKAMKEKVYNFLNNFKKQGN